MNYLLPYDLNEAEKQILESLKIDLSISTFKRLSVDLVFEGLKVTPLVFRIGKKLIELNLKPLFLFSDFGSAALSQRDYPEFKSNIITYKELKSNKIDNINDYIILAISPQPYNFDEFSTLLYDLENSVVNFNAKLEDTAIGIGSIGRDRRTNFISSWKTTYFLQPISNGALMYSFNEGWKLFYKSSNGYKYLQLFKTKPDDDLISDSISSEVRNN